MAVVLLLPCAGLLPPLDPLMIWLSASPEESRDLRMAITNEEWIHMHDMYMHNAHLQQRQSCGDTVSRLPVIRSLAKVSQRRHKLLVATTRVQRQAAWSGPAQCAAPACAERRHETLSVLSVMAAGFAERWERERERSYM